MDEGLELSFLIAEGYPLFYVLQASCHVLTWSKLSFSHFPPAAMIETMALVAASPTTNELGRNINETVDAMNMRLGCFVDQRLGYGILDGKTKQKLVTTGTAPFSAFTRSSVTCENVEHASKKNSSVKLNQAVHSIKIPVSFAQAADVSRNSHEEKITTLNRVTRILAKRSIPVPAFADLLPVRRGGYLDGRRWRVELYGNAVCSTPCHYTAKVLRTTEYYGAQTSITVTWSKRSNFSATQLASSIGVNESTTRNSQDYSSASATSNLEFDIRISTDGFDISPENSVTTLAGIQKLIQSIDAMPIRTPVPVNFETACIRATSGFPGEISVERNIRDTPTSERLESLLTRLERSGHGGSPTHEFVAYLMEKFEDATSENRRLLPVLRSLVSEVVQTLARHGEIVDLYDHKGELRIRTEVTSGAVASMVSEVVMGITLWTITPLVHGFQANRFDRARPWTVPNHYTTRILRSRDAFAGYYNYLEYELLFDDDNLVTAWRKRLDGYFENEPRAWYLDSHEQVSCAFCCIQ